MFEQLPLHLHQAKHLQLCNNKKKVGSMSMLATFLKMLLIIDIDLISAYLAIGCVTINY